MHYDPSSTAIVLVEFQRQWTAPGLYHRTIRRELARLGSIENAAALAAQARRAGALVVHAPLVIDPARKRGTLAHLTRGRVFRLGSPSAALEPRVHEPGDLIATGRTAFDPFTDSTLHELLRQHGTRTVLFAGFATDQCVGQGVATAVKLGYDAYLISDACATFTAALHTRAERRFPDRVLRTAAVAPNAARTA
jgi:nicotinamidase-related amidase